MRKPQAGKLKKPTECVRVRTAPKGTWKFPYGNFPELKGLNTYLDLLTRYVNDKYWNDESNGKSLKWSYDDLTKKKKTYKSGVERLSSFLARSGVLFEHCQLPPQGLLFDDFQIGGISRRGEVPGDEVANFVFVSRNQQKRINLNLELHMLFCHCSRKQF